MNYCRRGIVGCFLFVALCVTFVGCSSRPTDTVASTQVVSWNGIEPDTTSREEVIAILGPPDVDSRTGNERCFEYHLPGRECNTYNHRIFFHSDTVSWLDVAITVDRESPYTVSAAIEEWGSTVDRVVRTRIGRDIWTSEHIYIWASKGVAVIAVPESVLAWRLPESTTSECRSDTIPQERYPDEATPIIPEFGTFANPCHVIVRMIIFPPLSFEEFWEQYEHQMPGLWPFYEGYLQE
jgi:hypothetical protein